MLNVCQNCFNDEEIAGYIVSQNKRGDCDLCESKNTKILSLDELFSFFYELFTNFKSSPTGESLVDIIQKQWNFFKNNQIASDILNYMLTRVPSILDSSTDLVDYADHIMDNVNYWEKLKNQLKWENRYLTDINFLVYELGWDGFFQSQKRIDGKDIFYRARIHQKSNQSPFKVDDMFCPPKEFSTAGRANPSGIPYLYLSDNDTTILHEVKATYLDDVTVAVFKIKDALNKDVIIADFTEIVSLWAPGSIDSKIKATLLKKHISRDLSKPMRRYDSELDYIPTQFICEFIRDFTGVAGIKFKSSVHEDGNNYVIFDQELMSIVEVKKVEISKITIKSRKIE